MLKYLGLLELNLVWSFLGFGASGSRIAYFEGRHFLFSGLLLRVLGLVPLWDVRVWGYLGLRVLEPSRVLGLEVFWLQGILGGV